MAEIMPEVCARRLVLVDDQGRERIVLGFDPDGNPRVTLYHGDGEEEYSLHLASDPASAHLRMAKGDLGAALHLIAGADGHATVEATSSAHEDAATAMLAVSHRDGQPEASLFVGDGPSGFSAMVAGSVVDFRGGPVRLGLQDQRGVVFALEDVRLRSLGNGGS
ncbi:MAG: hypothetical protein KGR26_07795 [Cyanobacteria bacterium REEB65]|nr:hypothetical protein [Cyanobacteria bacterium REEB65]